MSDIDQYIEQFPPDVQEILQKIRTTVAKAVPKAQEKISYRIPAFMLDGIVIYFAAFKKHIGVFPPVRDPRLKKEVARYAGPKGNLQFPLNERIPYALIGRIAKAHAKANTARAAAKSKKKSAK
ncbi:MAG TPA: DUF1801 domain-containing protein [Steroidobacteraceae bacterium]|jgi:uncharacterized protein YdhG (YjbR/CyaY superfamily)|nr:DUF1801 domain-containing protein [Steroidobacteraceae bacterium]